MATVPATPARRLVELSLLAAVLGVCGGGIGYVFFRAISLLLNLTLLHRVGWTLPTLADIHPGWTLVPIAAAGGLVVAMFARWEPMVRGHGVPEAMEAVWAAQSRITPRMAIAKPVATAIAIGTGQPFGAEGPIIVTGGALGSLLGQTMRVSPAERKILLASGAAAGMSAIFGAPIGAVLLAIELLLFEFSTRTFVPLVVASVIADGMHTLLIRRGPLFPVPPHDFAGLERLPFYLVLGIASGLLAVLITKGVYAAEDGFARLPGRFWHPVIGGIGVALIGIAVPRTLGVGYDVIGDALAGKLALGTLAVVLGAKILAWWFAMGAGSSGSALAPIFLMGAAAGGILGTAFGHLAPSLGLASGAFAMAGMAATFGAAAGAPFASIALVFEMTRDYNVILPLMLATVVAHLLASTLMDENLMTEKLSRRGIRVSTDYRVDVLATTQTQEMMASDVATVRADATVGEVRHLFETSDGRAHPIVDDDGRCIGIVSLTDLVRRHEAPETPILAVASREVVTVGPEETLLAALHKMVHEGVNQLPVVRDGTIVGMCRRADILAARDREADLERLELGWWARRRGGRRA